jgi:Ca-activated chloride channel family protein
MFARPVIVFIIVRVILAAGTIVGLSDLTHSQSEEIRIDTSLVRVPVSVFDRDGRFIPNLQINNFKLFEDGKEQEISHFESYSEPITVLLLLDASGSMVPHFPRLAEAVSSFINQLQPEDNVMIATFVDDSKINILVNDKKKFLNGRIALTPKPGDHFTTTFDAVERGLKLMRSAKGRRRAMVLFSDGELFGWKASAKSNIRDAEEQDALIYTIRFGEYPTHQPGYDNSLLTEREKRSIRKKVDDYMMGLAAATGGRGFEVDQIAQLGSTFGEIAAELGRQYTLGYYPQAFSRRGERRQIKVTVDRPNVAVRSRTSYVLDR